MLNKSADNFYYSFDKDDSNIIKAVAILSIVMHNYLHLFSSIGENEMFFSLQTTMNFLTDLKANPLHFVNDFFIYFGHYGVELFIFISAYGLTKGFLYKSRRPYFKYLFDRLIKIYGLLIVGLVFYFVSKLSILPLREYIDIILHFFTMTYTFNGATMYFYVGPWWFFSLIVQLYVLFPILFYIIKRFKGGGVIALLFFSYLLIFALFYLAPQTSFPIFANATGHLPEFVLGICLAFFPKVRIDYRLIIPAALLFVGGCFVKALFPFTFLCVTIILLAAIKPLLKLPKDKWMIKGLMWVGKISMFMFLINGIIRGRILEWLYYNIGISPRILLITLIPHILVVILISYLIYLIYSRLSKCVQSKTGIRIL